MPFWYNTVVEEDSRRALAEVQRTYDRLAAQSKPRAAAAPAPETAPVVRVEPSRKASPEADEPEPRRKLLAQCLRRIGLNIC